MARKKATGSIFGQMALLIKACGKITKLTRWVSTPGMMEENTLENGKTTICMGLDTTFGLMVGSITASTRTTKKKALAFTSGLMAGSFKAGGARANNTV